MVFAQDWWSFAPPKGCMFVLSALFMSDSDREQSPAAPG